jgi:hypothetical protein
MAPRNIDALNDYLRTRGRAHKLVTPETNEPATEQEDVVPPSIRGSSGDGGKWSEPITDPNEQVNQVIRAALRR